MNKLCIIAKNKNTYLIKRLIEELGQDEIKLFDPWSDIELPQSHKYLVRTTGVYKNDLDLMMISALPQNSVINPLHSLKRFRSKKVQYEWFDEMNISSLPWLYVKEVNEITIEKFAILYPQVLVKPNFGQGGWGIEVFNKEGLLKWYKKQKRLADLDFIIQPFIAGADEFRYFFIKDQSFVLKRMGTTKVAANFRQEGKAEVSKLPQGQEILDKLILESGCHYGVVDLLIKDHEVMILELNSVPGVEQLEKISGVNVSRLLLESIL
ncbi:MAG: RimK family alpha-L-glutamate ligase [Bacteriovoracaceae bacterium]